MFYMKVRKAIMIRKYLTAIKGLEILLQFKVDRLIKENNCGVAECMKETSYFKGAMRDFSEVLWSNPLDFRMISVYKKDCRSQIREDISEFMNYQRKSY